MINDWSAIRPGCNERESAKKMFANEDVESNRTPFAVFNGIASGDACAPVV
ncbi:hypothetical protein BH20ACI1_BH20ACI1_29950 [soil metagenome]